jgi:hypothetical protein
MRISAVLERAFDRGPVIAGNGLEEFTVFTCTGQGSRHRDAKQETDQGSSHHLTSSGWVLSCISFSWYTSRRL